MSERLLRRIGRAYMVFVIAVVVFSLVTFAACYTPLVEVGTAPIVVGRAEDVALLSALSAAALGPTLLFFCDRYDVDPPNILVRYTLIAMLLCLFNMLFLPAIVTASVG